MARPPRTEFGAARRRAPMTSGISRGSYGTWEGPPSAPRVTADRPPRVAVVRPAPSLPGKERCSGLAVTHLGDARSGGKAPRRHSTDNPRSTALRRGTVRTGTESADPTRPDPTRPDPTRPDPTRPALAGA